MNLSKLQSEAVKQKPKELEWEKQLKTFFTKFHTYEELEKLVSHYLTQQRTELLEEIKKIEKEYSPYIRNHGLPEHKPLTLTNANREGYNQAVLDITNLLNKKDE